MKKLLFVLALGVFAACGNAENKEAATDSTAVAPVPEIDFTIDACWVNQIANSPSWNSSPNPI